MVMLLPCKAAEKLQERLFDVGYLTIPVRAQIDGKHHPCLRITPMATHAAEDIAGFAEALGKNKDLIG
jgi:7-keto-8-aminopelargonate synthetase-like enzyme